MDDASDCSDQISKPESDHESVLSDLEEEAEQEAEQGQSSGDISSDDGAGVAANTCGPGPALPGSGVLWNNGCFSLSRYYHGDGQSDCKMWIHAKWRTEAALSHL